MKIVVVPATYNEKDNIEKFIPLVEEEVFPKIKNHDMQILVADDESPDGTGEAVTKLMKKYKNLHLNSGPKKGLGAAYIRAMSYAIEKMGADVVMSIDADLQHDPHKIPDFVKKIDEGYDIVVATRYSQGGSIPKNWPPQRKLFSVMGNLIVRTITGRFSIHDWTGGFRAIKSDVFMKEREKVRPFQGYTFQVAFLYKSVLDGYKIGEVPIHFMDRTLGKSKIAPIEYIVNLLTYVITERIHEILTGSFGKFLVVGGLGFAINAIVLRVLVDAAHYNPSVANLVGAALAIFSNFNFNNLWTFKEQKIHGLREYFWKMLQFYATSAFGVIFIQTGTIFILDHLIGTKYYFYYFLLGTFFILIWNYFIYSKFIWRKKASK
ncbi:MAG TPA: glycosyltransferase family 2 protein [Patescibacteria group bacterium]|nr:glycosyltransferase family 2 protein [Patescibacteria group bacterium]